MLISKKLFHFHSNLEQKQSEMHMVCQVKVDLRVHVKQLHAFPFSNGSYFVYWMLPYANVAIWVHPFPLNDQNKKKNTQKNYFIEPDYKAAIIPGPD